MLTIHTVAVLGANDTGTVCALLSALAGCSVRLHDPDDTALGAAPDLVRRRVELGVAQGIFTATERQRILDGILFTADLDEALTAADLAVDASTTPSPPAARVAAALRATAAIAAAGATPAADLAAALPQPGRVLTLRLGATGGPVPRLEVDPAPSTTGHVLERARAFAARVNRAARVPSPGAP